MCGAGACAQFYLKHEQGAHPWVPVATAWYLPSSVAAGASDGERKPDGAPSRPREAFGGSPERLGPIQPPSCTWKGALPPHGPTWPPCHPGISFQPTRVTHDPRTCVPLSSVQAAPSCPRPPQGTPLTAEDPDQVSPSAGRVGCPPRDSPALCPMPPQSQSSNSSQERSAVLTPTSGDVGREQWGAGHLRPPLHQTPRTAASLCSGITSFSPEQGSGVGVIIPIIQIGKPRRREVK